MFHPPERQRVQIPLQINSEHADLSQAARAAIEHEVGRLEKCEHHITGCRVAVVAPSTKHRHGSVYRINIWVTIPPHENIVVSHQPSDDRGHDDVLGSIKDAFAAARRQIDALAKH
jgi:ribosome-associated translation inhibitor RaiA